MIRYLKACPGQIEKGLAERLNGTFTFKLHQEGHRDRPRRVRRLVCIPDQPIAPGQDVELFLVGLPKCVALTDPLAVEHEKDPESAISLFRLSEEGTVALSYAAVQLSVTPARTLLTEQAVGRDRPPQVW